MKSLSRILAICLCSAPFVQVAWGVVATNSGSNLTAFNPSNAYNNQWATLSNGRGDMATPTAKVNFGNCNSLILRCAQPKCGNGGCTDMTVAGAIVAGCVQSNKSCEQYGDDLVSYMSAQLVANSNAKINAQNAAAAQAANAAQQEQITAMQEQMQQQMAQMQQQMAQQSAQMQQQNEQTQQQIQAALDAQAQQNQAALDNMASAATTVAQQNESGLTSYQQEAIERNIPEDVLVRKTVTGQIMTEIEDAENSLKTVETAMRDAFEYAGCDRRGNNCTGPKRVKKFRERALGFIDPYDNVINKIYDAIEDAQMVGVDLSEIYMMLDDSCNRWGEYLCPQGTVVYDQNQKGQKGAPSVCENTAYQQCLVGCNALYVANKNDPSTALSADALLQGCIAGCPKPTKNNGCQPCTLVKILTDNDDIYRGWVNAETTSTENQRVVACASAALDNSKILRRARKKRAGGTVDLDLLELWLSQVEPSVSTTSNGGPDYFINYCRAEDQEQVLKKSMLSKSIDPDHKLCVRDLEIDPYLVGPFSDPTNIKGYDVPEDESCSYINRIYALCDTHMYNAGKTKPADLKNSEVKSGIKNIVALKSTVIAQQMYKQYEFLAATLRRLKTHLEKSVLSASLQAAGGSSSGGSSSGGGSVVDDDDKNVVLKDATNCSGLLDFDQFVTCLQSNVSLIKTHVNSNVQNACKQLQKTLDQADSRFKMEGYGDNNGGDNKGDVGAWSYCGDGKGGYLGKSGERTCQGSKKKQDIIDCANEIITRAAAIKRRIDASKNRRYF